MPEPIPTHKVYGRSVRPPETTELTELVRAMRRAPEAQRREFWDAIRESIMDTGQECVPPYVELAPRRPSLVYYLRFGDRVKIGFTTNLSERLKSIPHDEVLATEAGPMRVERERHAEFADLRVIGEWFRYEEPLISHIASLM